MSSQQDIYSRWMRELIRYLPIKTQFYVYGNVYDQIPYPIRNPETSETQWTYFYLRPFFHRFFSDRSYQLIGFYDIVDGVSFYSDPEQSLFDRLRGGKEVKPHTRNPESQPSSDRYTRPRTQGRFTQPLEALGAIRTVIANEGVPCAFVLDHASRLLSIPDQLEEGERRYFLTLAKCIQESARVRIGEETFNNVIILVCDKLNDLPAWLYLNNPLVKSIQIDRPNEVERRRYFQLTINGFHRSEELTNKEQTIEKLVDLTHGLGNYELESLRLLSVREKIPVKNPKEIIERYKFGVTESAWDRISPDKLQNAESELREWVRGQDAAIKAAVDIIKRAATGLSGVHHSSGAHKPRGILFFAGPTGVGKTELAKALARLLFGDENACIRFDMSEYGQEHSDQRLLGAPPGYVGYEEGGQLTNKVKESPFSVLLFDEIEKAHPKILDKFLQILDDGRMTDGKGETVYFSESIVIFTSNIGAYEDIPAGDGRVIRRPNILPYSWRCENCEELYTQDQAPAHCNLCDETSFDRVETPYTLVKERMLRALEEHFKFKLGRPEIYNRFGNNFVVFDYIRPKLMREIIDKILNNIARELQERKKITVTFSDEVKDFILEQASKNVEMGGRGVGNMIETVLVNPLGRYLFDQGDPEGIALHITEIVEDQQPDFINYTLEVEHESVP